MTERRQRCSTHSEVAGVEDSTFPGGQPARAAFRVTVDAFVEDEVDPALPALPFDVIAILVRIRRGEELRPAVNNCHLLRWVFLLDLRRKF